MKTMITLLSFCLMVSCTSMISTMDNSILIGDDLQASRYKNTYFSEQPSNNDYKKLKDQGFETIINLRSPDEYDEQGEKVIVEESGMNYINLPFPKDLKITKKFVQKLHERVEKNSEDGKVLIHCSTGNRSYIWLGAELHEFEGYTKEESLELSKRMGLDKKKAIDALRDYFDMDYNKKY